jgi:hypothetical protein
MTVTAFRRKASENLAQTCGVSQNKFMRRADMPARFENRQHAAFAPALSKLRLLLFSLTSNRRFAGIAQRLRGLQEFQITL